MAAIGDVFFDPAFRFHDGEIGEKRLIILAVSATRPPDYVTVVTTSQARLRNNKPGCQNDDPWNPGFHIITNISPIFELDTWVCLDRAYSLDITDFDSKVGSKYRLLGNLQPELLCQILRCASSAEFSGFEIKGIYAAIDSLGCPA